MGQPGAGKQPRCKHSRDASTTAMQAQQPRCKHNSRDASTTAAMQAQPRCKHNRDASTTAAMQAQPRCKHSRDASTAVLKHRGAHTLNLPNQLSAQITLVGMTLDSVGGLYLAYDLLGGENGPLSRIFRIVNYSVLVILVFWLPMGLGFAIVAGLALGTALALQVERAAHGLPESNRFLLCMGLIRATGLSLATCVNKHYLMAAILFPFVVATTIILPKFKLSPATTYHAGKRPVLKKNQVVLAAVLGVATLLFGWFSASIAGNGTHAMAFATKVGVTFAFAVIFVSSLSPLVEWYADNLPPKSFGYLGAVMFMLGFLVQAVPALLTIIEF